MHDSQPDGGIEPLVGFTILAVFITGTGGLVLALIAFFNDYDYATTAQALLVAAVAFGLLANALLRE